MSPLHQDLLTAAAALESALIRRLTDNATIGVRVRAPKDIQGDPACVAAAAFANLAELRLLFPNTAGAVDLHPAMLNALGPRAIAAAAESAGFAATDVTLECDEAGLAALGDDGLPLVEKFKARGFALRLNCSADAPMGLSQRARDVFCSAQTPATAALAASADVWADPMARRLVTAKAAGFELVADNARPEDVSALAEAGFSAACFATAA
ncbi:MAG: hypothetical protein ABWZ40_12690 [Caulobacterales bacterium]